MITKIIYLPSNKGSVSSAKHVLEAAAIFDPELYAGTTPDQISSADYKLYEDGMFFGPAMFGTECTSLSADVACWYSHYSLWQLCVERQENILVLEDDAMPRRELSHDLVELFDKFDGDLLMVGLPSWGVPSGVYRDAKRAAYRIEAREDCCSFADYNSPWFPSCDCNSVHLHGTHAYVVSPRGAKKLIDAKDKGLMAADVYMRNDVVHIYDYTPFPFRHDTSMKESLIKIPR